LRVGRPDRKLSRCGRQAGRAAPSSIFDGAASCKDRRPRSELESAAHPFNPHVPPFGSGLDHCPRLDTSVDPPRPVAGEEISAGSTAVVEAIRTYQPALSLHGHIHEAAGIRQIGRTICINVSFETAPG
jgi:Icc-related predicted phosphoesterase